MGLRGAGDHDGPPGFSTWHGVTFDPNQSREKATGSGSHSLSYSYHLIAGGKLQQAALPRLLVVKFQLLICAECGILPDGLPTT
jgi:hypothetical protein